MSSNSNDKVKKDNVVQVPPRRYRVFHKGLHGWIEYLPSCKLWRWVFKARFVIENQGHYKTEDEAKLELKKYIDVTASSKRIESID